MNGRSLARSSLESGSPPRVATPYAMPRSMREIAARPQLCAMSVALDAQAEIVGVLAAVRPVRQDLLERRVLGRGKLTIDMDEMPEIRNNAGGAGPG
jgi:hypothetical protein